MYEDFFWRMTPGTENSAERIASIVIPIILALLAIILLWPKIDMLPATEEDYKSLYEYLESIEGKPEEFFNQEGKITVLEDSISYEIENKECKMTGKYNRDFELISTSQTDKSTTLFKSIIGFIALAALVFFIGIACTYIVIGIVEFIIISIIIIIKKLLNARRHHREKRI